MQIREIVSLKTTSFNWWQEEKNRYPEKERLSARDTLSANKSLSALATERGRICPLQRRGPTGVDQRVPPVTIISTTNLCFPRVTIGETRAWENRVRSVIPRVIERTHVWDSRLPITCLSAEMLPRNWIFIYKKSSVFAWRLRISDFFTSDFFIV